MARIRATALVFLDEELYRKIWEGWDRGYVIEEIERRLESNGIRENPLIRELRELKWGRYEILQEIAEELIEYVRDPKKTFFGENHSKKGKSNVAYLSKREYL